MAETANARITTTDTNLEDGEDKKLFDDLSFSTVIASALAAITSFLLQSQIGLTGSLIGVGVAAAASALASQVYKSVLSASASKIKDNLTSDSTGQDNMKSGKTRIAGAGMTYVRQKPIPSWQKDDADKTTVTDRTYDLSSTRIAPDTIRGAVAKRKSDTMKRRAAIFTAVVAIIAVLIYAAVVTFATQGKGIGSTPTITESSPSEEPSTQDTTNGTGQTHGTGTTGGQGNNAPNANQGTDGGTAIDTGSSTTGSTGETGDTAPAPTTPTSTTGNTGSTGTGNAGTSGSTTGTGTSDTNSNSNSGSGTNHNGTGNSNGSGKGSTNWGENPGSTGSGGQGSSDTSSGSKNGSAGSAGGSGSGSDTTTDAGNSNSSNGSKARPSSTISANSPH